MDDPSANAAGPGELPCALGTPMLRTTPGGHSSHFDPIALGLNANLMMGLEEGALSPG